MHFFRALSDNVKNILLIFFSLLLTIFLTELFLRLFTVQNLSGSWRVENSFGIIMNKSYGQANHIHKNRKVTYKFFDFGLRGANPEKNKKKILLLGDSFTFGWLLNNEDTYHYLLQQKLNNHFDYKYQIINAAAGGWGTADYLKYVEVHLEKLEFDYILVVINTDDIRRSYNSGLYKLSDNGKLISNDKKIKISKKKRFVNAIPIYNYLIENSYLLYVIRKSYVILFHQEFNSNFLEDKKSVKESIEFKEKSKKDSLVQAHEINEKLKIQSIALGNKLFEKLIKLANNNNKKLLVTTTGCHKNDRTALIKKNISLRSNFQTKEFMKQAPDFFSSYNIPYYDYSDKISHIINADPEKYFISGDSHPNENGAKLIAENIWPWLKNVLK